MLYPAGLIALILFFLSFIHDKDDKNGSFGKPKKKAVRPASDTGELTEREIERLVREERPVICRGQSIFYNTSALNRAVSKSSTYSYKGTLRLDEEAPVISVYENGNKVQEYVLQPKKNEDLTGKRFRFETKVYFEKQSCLVALTEGYIVNMGEDISKTTYDMLRISYRLEKHYFEKDTKNICSVSYLRTNGKELESKGLRFPGKVTGKNVRCVGICQKCGKSFTFFTYNYPKEYAEPVYSDDGLYVYKLTEKIPDKQLLTWKREKDGKTFRYYNSFCCPHCGEPYIDYRRNRELKRMGNLACVHIGHKEYSGY